MNYQITAFITSLKKTIPWCVIYILFLILYCYLIFNSPNDITKYDMVEVLGIFYENNAYSLFVLYQFFVILYMIHTFFMFEKTHSLEFINCRISRTKSFILKAIISFFSVLLIRIFCFFIIYNLFYEYVNIKFSYFLINVMEYSVIWLVYILIYILFSWIINKNLKNN